MDFTIGCNAFSKKISTDAAQWYCSQSFRTNNRSLALGSDSISFIQPPVLALRCSKALFRALVKWRPTFTTPLFLCHQMYTPGCHIKGALDVRASSTDKLKNSNLSAIAPNSSRKQLCTSLTFIYMHNDQAVRRKRSAA